MEPFLEFLEMCGISYLMEQRGLCNNTSIIWVLSYFAPQCSGLLVTSITLIVAFIVNQGDFANIGGACI
jgi:hypothetical protein